MAEVLLAELPFLDPSSLDKSYEGEIQNLGDIVNIHSVPEFSDATELAEGARNDADSVTMSTQQLVINKRFAKDFIVTKRSQLQSLEYMDKVRDKAAFAISKKMQSEIISAIVPVGANAISYDSGTTLALADLLEGKELLDSNNVPRENRKAISGVAQENDLFNITGKCIARIAA
jgi:hypothetical protein